MKYQKLLLSVWFIVLMFSCRTAGKPGARLSRAEFIDSFKTISFCRCVELANNKKLDLADDDVSCRPPDWLYSEGDAIDSLVLREVKKIRLDSLDRAQYQVAEGMDGKHVISSCLTFYNSQALETSARRRAKFLGY
ncbi:hypothetical protein [Rufibacter sp. DG15C]|uniref:hypothetical protein n=1 Tax=Rufibacter sp. DG15C TaxID=1379909 RepID=UPI000A77AA4D|nr:hypothetical protein [Rufibacter sp. DG15C]